MSQENVERLHELYRIWNGGDFGSGWYAPDLEWDQTQWAPDAPDVARGVDRVRSLIARFMDTWTDVRFEPQRFVDRGDRVLVLVDVYGRGKTGGVPFLDHTAHLFTFRDGLVTRVAHYRDQCDALDAVGLSE